MGYPIGSNRVGSASRTEGELLHYASPLKERGQGEERNRGDSDSPPTSPPTGRDPRPARELGLQITSRRRDTARRAVSAHRD